MKSLHLLLCGLFLIGLQQNYAQSNLGMQEYERRQQEAALQRARQLKAAKEAAVQVGRSSPPQVSANPSARGQSAPPPPQFRLVTANGVVNWTPGTPMPVPQARPSEKPRRSTREKPPREESQLKTVRFSFGRQNPNETDGEQANVQALEQSDGAPLVDVGPAEEASEGEEEELPPSRFPWRSRRTEESSEPEETELEDVVAILEEIPEEDGKPARTRILGVLMRGNTPSEADGPEAEENKPMLVAFNRETPEAPDETSSESEEETETEDTTEEDETTLSEERAYAVRGLRSLFEGPSNREEQTEDIESEVEEEPIEVASIEPTDNRKWRKWLGLQTKSGSPDEPDETEIEDEYSPQDESEPEGPIDPNFFAIDVSSAPFHVIDSGPEDTFVVELEQGAVGRAHGSGENWTWLEMHDGLMGLMRKKHVRPARQSEVMNFLAMESGSGVGNREPIQFVEIDLPDLPEDVSEAGMFLGEGLLPALTDTTISDPPAEPMTEEVVEETPEPVVEKTAAPLE